MFALLGIVFPFLKSFLGEGIVQSYLNHKKDLAQTANEAEKVKIQADVNMAAYELERRKAQRDIQIAELPYSEMRRAKALLMWSIALYWFARFMIEVLGLGDYNIAIHPLSADMDAVSKMILAYLFLDGTIKRVTAK
jgi:hypothetical protein